MIGSNDPKLDLLREFDVSYSDCMALIRSAITACTIQSQQRLTASKILVGASVLTSEGQISSGSSFESEAGIAGDMSAEDCAIYRAICDGCQLPIKAMAIHVKHFLQESCN